MRAILLAAGVGSRIASKIGNLPKSLVEVDGEPLIVRTVKMLRRNHLEVSVITGFRHELVEEALTPYEVDVVYNPFYEVTNSLGSLWLARDRLVGSDILIANADVFYEQDLLNALLSAEFDVFLANDSSRQEEGDYFFLTEGGCIKKFGKELETSERDSEYVGLALLHNDWIRRFRDRLNAMVERGEYGLWWENVLYSFVDGGYDIRAVDVAGCFWAEVDTLSDYERILTYLSKSA